MLIQLNKNIKNINFGNNNKNLFIINILILLFKS